DGNLAGEPLRRTSRVRIAGEDDVHAGLDELTCGRVEGGGVPLSEPGPDDELLVFSITQRQEPGAEPHRLGCRAPGLPQHPNVDRSRAFGRTRDSAMEAGADEQPEKGQAASPESSLTRSARAAVSHCRPRAVQLHLLWEREEDLDRIGHFLEEAPSQASRSSL